MEGCWEGGLGKGLFSRRLCMVEAAALYIDSIVLLLVLIEVGALEHGR